MKRILNRIDLFFHYIWWTRKLTKPYRLSFKRMWQISNKLNNKSYERKLNDKNAN